MDNILSIITFIPAFAAGLMALLLRGEDEAGQRNAKWIALLATTITFLASLYIYVNFDATNTGFQFVEEADWIFGLKYKMGVDGISVLFVLLTTFVMPLTILASWNVTVRVKEYMVAFLLLETLMLGVFMALDLVLFYLFFEAGLIPMFLIIGIWGGKERIYASFKFFLYTFFGSVLMLVAMVAMYADAGTTDIETLLTHSFSAASFDVLGIHVVGGMQTLMFLAFFASFAVKMPMWPVHTWLPDAHVQAPTAGSVILAGVLLKLGGYGFIRFSLPMFPEASAQFAWLVFVLSMVAVIYTSLVALVQNDMKKLIAYSSVAHMAIVTVGIFAFNVQGIEGAMMVMLGHGLVSGALFLCVGVIYDRLHTREIARYGGLSINMPKYALFFLLFTMASIGLPGTSNFVGEFLALAGIYKVSTLVTLVCTTGIILGAAYMLYLYRRVAFGEQLNEDAARMPDLNAREWAILAPIAAAVLWMGVYPESFLAPMRQDIAALEARVARAAPDFDADNVVGTPREHNANYVEGAHGEAHGIEGAH